MSKINMSRVVIGGLVAGLLINVSEYVLNVIVLDAQWHETMASLNRPMAESVGAIVAFNIVGFLIGIFTVWLYAAIRPRYGAGPNTALCAGAAVWFIGYVLALSAPAITGILPMRLIGISLVWGLVEILIAAVVGARLYREEEAPAGVSAAAAGR
jgi:hypothetical protein